MGRLLDEDIVIDIINFECGKWTGLSKTIEKEIKALPPAQPELIEKAAYIRGFEQGRTQGMIDAQERKK